MVNPRPFRLVVMFVSAFCLLHSALGSAQAADLQRFIGPVRLSYDPAQAARAVPKTRAILEKFRQGGFNTAIWAVDKLPVKVGEIAPWTMKCLEAFPAKPVIALDFNLGGPANKDGNPPPDKERLRLFLGQALPRAHACLANFTHLNNYANPENAPAAMAAVQANIALVREISPSTVLWLLVDDDPKAAPRIPEWIESMAGLVDGFYLFRWHEWNAGRETAYAPPAGIRQTGKPVLRGGFQYMAPRLRPGIERDLIAQYRERMQTYEAWVKSAGFAGYEREIGAFIPGDVSPNMNLLPE